LIVALLVLTASSASGQPTGQTRSGFSLYARALLSEDRRPSIKVSAHVPYSNLVFLKKDDEFEARYRLYIRIFDKSGKNMLDSHVVSKEVAASTYEDTRSQKNSSTLSHQVEIAPGDYIVRCTVHVANTQRAFSNETSVTVPDIMQSGVSLSKPRLFAVEVDTSRMASVLHKVDTGEKFYAEQKDEATFIALDSQPAFQFDVYLEKAVRDSTLCDLVYEVVDEQNEQVLYGKRRVRLAGAEDQFVASFNVDDWDTGRYVFNVKATVHNPTRATVASLPFDLEFTRAMLTKYFDTTVAILSIIATSEEIRELEEAAEGQRGAVWAAFWVRRDPSPGTEENEALDEHWRRVRHAEKNFATNEPGWRSDRGRIYIRYGEPDEVEVRSDPYVQGQYLIWRYYKNNLTFVFHDRFGLGEYILSNSSTF
jgi:GWxTD domain-containing protein